MREYNRVICYYQLSWPPWRVSKLMFRVLALRHSLWCGQFTLSAQVIIPNNHISQIVFFFNWITSKFVFCLHDRHLKKCLVDYGTREYSAWVLAHPGQAILTVVSDKLKTQGNVIIFQVFLLLVASTWNSGALKFNTILKILNVLSPYCKFVSLPPLRV